MNTSLEISIKQEINIGFCMLLFKFKFAKTHILKTCF